MSEVKTDTVETISFGISWYNLDTGKYEHV
nr:MAG TPA: hypothetical protein [Bacteriophage sp.]